jgi:hypothetical protein
METRDFINSTIQLQYVIKEEYLGEPLLVKVGIFWDNFWRR